MGRELHACDLLAGLGKLVRIDNTGRRFTPEQGAEVYMDGLRIIESAAHVLGGIEVVNVSLDKVDVKGYEHVSLDPLLNRINASVAADGRYSHLIFDEGGEQMVKRPKAGSKAANPCPATTRCGRTARRRRTSPESKSSEARPSDAPGRTICYRWPTSSPTPSSSRRRSSPQG